MRKFIIGVALLTTTLGFSQEQIRTKLSEKTQITIHGRLYAEGLFEEMNSFIFKCAQFQGISIFKPIVLSKEDTEKLYQALISKDHKNGDVVDIVTLDNKLVHIEYKRYMFKLYPIFDIIDKDNDSVYHIYCLPKNQLDRLFNKI